MTMHDAPVAARYIAQIVKVAAAGRATDPPDTAYGPPPSIFRARQIATTFQVLSLSLELQLQIVEAYILSSVRRDHLILCDRAFHPSDRLATQSINMV